MITQEQATVLAAEWIAAWNSHDLDRVLDHYTDDFEMTSPFIAGVMDESSGMLKGKTNVGAYWQKALERYPDLHFKLEDVLWGVSSVTIVYRSVDGRSAAEWLQLDAGGKVCRAMAHYSR